MTISVKDWRLYNEAFDTLPNGEVLIRNIDDNTIYRIKSSLLAGGNDNAEEWKSSTPYNTGDIVVFQSKLWQALEDSLGQTPIEGSFWTEVSKSEANGFGRYAPGVFTIDPTMVLNGDKAYALSENTPLPFNSTDFNAELSAGVWVEFGGNVFDYIRLNKDVSPPVITDEGDLLWCDRFHSVKYDTGLGATVTVGNVEYIVFYNDTGDTIPSGRVMHLLSGFVYEGNLYPTFEFADPRDWRKVQGTLGMTIHSIEDGTLGLLAKSAQLINADTSGVNAGAQLWVKPDGSGEFTSTIPQFPNIPISIGGSYDSSASGSIFFNITTGINELINNSWDGSIIESFDFLITSDGSVITGTLSNKDNTRDLVAKYSTGLHTINTTTSPLTITIPAGTDVNPQEVYIYIPESTKVLTTSTSGWPSSEHSKVAQCTLQSAATTQANRGALRNQNINDHLKTTGDNGHILHIAERIRRLNAEHDNGTEGSLDNTGGNGYVVVTGGQVWQMHKQDFPAINMATGGIIKIVNDFTTPYRETGNLASITSYSTGSSWNNEWSKIVVWGIANKTGEASFLMANLPKDGYNSEENAANDGENYANYSIPNQYKGVGFLIAAFTVRISGGTITYNASEGYEDLRGFIPNNIAGGGNTGGGGATSFLALTDTFSSYAGRAGQSLIVSEAETGVDSEPKNWFYNDARTFKAIFDNEAATQDNTHALPNKSGTFVHDESLPFTKWQYGVDPSVATAFNVNTTFFGVHKTSLSGDARCASVWSIGDIVEARGNLGGYMSFKIERTIDYGTHFIYVGVPGSNQVAFTADEIGSFSLQGVADGYTPISQSGTDYNLIAGKKYAWGYVNMTSKLPTGKEGATVGMYISSNNGTTNTITSPEGKNIDGAASLVLDDSYNGWIIEIAWDYTAGEWKVKRLDDTVKTDGTPTGSLSYEQDQISSLANKIVMSGDLNLSLDTSKNNIVGKSNFFDVQTDGVGAINLVSGFKTGAVIPSDLNGKVVDAGTYQFYSIYTPDGIDLKVPSLSGGAVIPQLNAPMLGTPIVDSSTQITVPVTDTNTSPNEVNTEMFYREDGETVWISHGFMAQDGTSYAYTGLTASTDYEFKGIAKGNGSESTDSVDSNLVTGTTDAGASAPTVTTQAATDITATTATGNGNVVADGGASVTDRGVVWGESQNPTLGDSSSSGGSGTGIFTAPITGLVDSTLYYVRAYATNSVGTSYGNELSFVAEDLVLPTITQYELAGDNSYVIFNSNIGLWGDISNTIPVSASDLIITNFAAGGITNASIISLEKETGGALTGGETSIKVNITNVGTANGTAKYQIQPATSTSIYGAGGGAMSDVETTGFIYPVLQGTPLDVNFSLLTGITQSGTEWLASGGGVWNSNIARSDIQLTGSGYFQCDLPDSSNRCMLGFNVSSLNQGYVSYEEGLFSNKPSLFRVVAGAVADTGFDLSDGDIIRLRRSVDKTVIEVSSNSGLTFVRIYESPRSDTSAYWLQISANSATDGDKVINPKILQ